MLLCKICEANTVSRLGDTCTICQLKSYRLLADELAAALLCVRAGVSDHLWKSLDSYLDEQIFMVAQMVAGLKKVKASLAKYEAQKQGG